MGSGLTTEAGLVKMRLSEKPLSGVKTYSNLTKMR